MCTKNIKEQNTKVTSVALKTHDKNPQQHDLIHEAAGVKKTNVKNISLLYYIGRMKKSEDRFLKGFS